VPGDRGWDEADREALEVLRPLLDAGGYLPWTEGALRPAALVVACNEIALGERGEVVELGSGVSTVVLARLLRERGGRLTSLEHDPHWARFVDEQLEREELAGVATLIQAPLEPHEAALDGAGWYSASAVAAIPSEIELLLIDGPPAGEGAERSRYPALTVLAGHLAASAVVVLDDAARTGEQDVLRRWQESGEWRFGTHEALGIAVGRRPN
jgi:predicted O-methyltransferase YrrM